MQLSPPIPVGVACHARRLVVDATWTLLNRYRLKCRLSEAHRTHAFQYAARHWKVIVM